MFNIKYFITHIFYRPMVSDPTVYVLTALVLGGNIGLIVALARSYMNGPVISGRVPETNIMTSYPIAGAIVGVCVGLGVVLVPM